MKVILLENVANLGKVGSCVEVKPGFARNGLIPQGRAIAANKENIAEFELKREELEKKAAEVLVEAEKRAVKLKAISITLKSQASDEGKLFGSITPREIASAVTAQGHSLEKQEINMPEGPIRTTGEHTINIQLHSDVKFDMQINVEPEA